MGNLKLINVELLRKDMRLFIILKNIKKSLIYEIPDVLYLK